MKVFFRPRPGVWTVDKTTTEVWTFSRRWHAHQQRGCLVLFHSQGLKSGAFFCFVLSFITHSSALISLSTDKTVSSSPRRRNLAIHTLLLLSDWMWAQRYFGHFTDCCCHFVLVRVESEEKQRSCPIRQWMDSQLKTYKPFSVCVGRLNEQMLKMFQKIRTNKMFLNEKKIQLSKNCELETFTLFKLWLWSWFKRRRIYVV